MANRKCALYIAYEAKSIFYEEALSQQHRSWDRRWKQKSIIVIKRPTIDKAPTDIIVPLKQAHREFLAFLVRESCWCSWAACGQGSSDNERWRVGQWVSPWATKRKTKRTVGILECFRGSKCFLVRIFTVYSARLSRMVIFGWWWCVQVGGEKGRIFNFLTSFLRLEWYHNFIFDRRFHNYFF